MNWTIQCNNRRNEEGVGTCCSLMWHCHTKMRHWGQASLPPTHPPTQHTDCRPAALWKRNQEEGKKTKATGALRSNLQPPDSEGKGSQNITHCPSDRLTQTLFTKDCCLLYLETSSREEDPCSRKRRPSQENSLHTQISSFAGECWSDRWELWYAFSSPPPLWASHLFLQTVPSEVFKAGWFTFTAVDAAVTVMPCL